MKKEWSEQNKSIQLQLKKNDTFAEGIDTLIMLRKGLMHEILQFKDELYNYMVDVDKATTEILKSLTYQNLKDRISIEKRNKLEELQVVSTDENAYWLVDYWCNKDVRGLIQMPFSRHWIMHIEACLKIRDKII